jgi:hypothetical protein
VTSSSAYTKPQPLAFLGEEIAGVSLTRAGSTKVSLTGENSSIDSRASFLAGVLRDNLDRLASDFEAAEALPESCTFLAENFMAVSGFDFGVF